MKIRQFANVTSINTLKIAAISTLAIGAGATISAAPASAVVLTTGMLSFNDGAVNTTGTIPGPLTAAFNNGGSAIVVQASGGFAPLFGATPPTPRSIVADTVGLTFNGGNLYTSTDSLIFNFTGIGQVTIGAGRTFTSVAATQPASTTFSLVGNAGTFTTLDAAVTALNISSFDFTVENISGSANGSYSLIASVVPPTAVPEPFTIIGTIIGGTAAFRMRKKLAK